MSAKAKGSPKKNKKLTVSDTLYKKLKKDGTVDPSGLGQSDFNKVTAFMKTTFPNATRVQAQLQDSLKRTFTIGRPDLSKKANKKEKFTKAKPVLNRRTRLKLQERVPRKLDFQQFVHLNSLWKAYVVDLCGTTPQPTDIQAKLNKVDLHGAFIKVVQANCDSYENVTGIVIKESRNTFVIVTQENFTKIIPKAENVFDIKLDNPDGTMRIAGNSFRTRPAERACKKMKSFMNFVGLKLYKSKLKYGRIEKMST